MWEWSRRERFFRNKYEDSYFLGWEIEMCHRRLVCDHDYHSHRKCFDQANHYARDWTWNDKVRYWNAQQKAKHHQWIVDVSPFPSCTVNRTAADS